MGANWFRTGVISEEEAKTAFNPAGSSSKRPVRDNRFWLPHGEKSEIVFLDGTDDGFRIFEHDFEINGRFGNTFTCTEGFYPGICALCELAKRRGKKGSRSSVSFFSILQIHDPSGGTTGNHNKPWTDSDGVVHLFARRLFPAKRETLTKIKMLREQAAGSMAGTKLVVMRSKPMPGDTKSKIPRVGDILQPMGKVDLAAFTQKDGKPVTSFDYQEILKPKTPEEIKKFVEDLDRGAVQAEDAREVAY